VKKSILFLITLLFSAGLFAQTPKKNEAETLMERISKRYKAFKTMKADFSYAIESRQNKNTEKQKGQILIKGNKFKLDIANQLIICDNKTVWTYSKEINEVQISKYDSKTNAVRLDDLFTMYSKGFLYKLLDKKNEPGKEIVVVELTPKDKKKNFFKIKVTVDKTNQTILSSQVFDKSGTIHTYSVINQVPNLIFKDNQFGFDTKQYPGCEVVDLR
jgi:outer membrane lipoprotein-sorting protein